MIWRVWKASSTGRGRVNVVLAIEREIWDTQPEGKERKRLETGARKCASSFVGGEKGYERWLWYSNSARRTKKSSGCRAAEQNEPS